MDFGKKIKINARSLDNFFLDRIFLEKFAFLLIEWNEVYQPLLESKN